MEAKQIQVPISKEKNPTILQIAKFIRSNSILKNRTGLLNGETNIDFFRYKRFVRLLLSEEYAAKASNPKNGLLPIKDKTQAAQIFVEFIKNQLVIPLQKLHYDEIKQNNLKPNKEYPTLLVKQKAELFDDQYYGWMYTKPNPFLILYSILGIVGIFTIILFPLWPMFMRRGVWFLSMGLLGLIVLFFIVALIRLVIYVISIALGRGFWLYPNLFEDCGFFDSFVPLYSWEEKSVPKSKKVNKTKESKKNE